MTNLGGGKTHGGASSREAAEPAKPFIPTFPNYRFFSPRNSKHSFGGFVEFQRVAIGAGPNFASPNFFALDRCQRREPLPFR